MIYFMFTLLAAFGIGFTCMAWYLGLFRDFFSSTKAYNVNMFIFLCFVLYMGVWSQTMYIS